MINASIVNTLLKVILGQTYPLGSDYRTSNRAYICLGSSITFTESGDIQHMEEPSAASGYSRYLIGAYSYEGNPGSLVNKCSVTNGEAYNTDTLYFDEAKEDWPTIYYFGIANGLNSEPVAYGYIVDDNGVRTTLSVRNGQVPIIRKNQLQLAIQDLETVPSTKYNFDAYFEELTHIYTGTIKTTNIVKSQNSVLYSQVIITDLNPDAISQTTLEEGQILFIPALQQSVDEDIKVQIYDNNLNPIAAKIKITSIAE